MRFSILALVALLALGVPAFAAKDAPGEHKEAAHGSESGMLDKLSFTGIKRYDLGIYTLIVFGLLLFILNKYAWPHISEGLKKREAAILGAREEAAKAKVEAEELRAKLQKDFAEAQDKIRAMLDEARRDSDALRVTEREAGARDAQAERERAKREIQAEKDAVLQELYQQAVQLASMLSSKTLRRQMSPDDHRRLLDESLAELRGSVGKA
jgi:F-type H+-transporting ATPase subunit b